jgi:hypothetical protein
MSIIGFSALGQQQREQLSRIRRRLEKSAWPLNAEAALADCLIATIDALLSHESDEQQQKETASWR